MHDAVETLAHQMAGAALDYAALGPHVSARLWQIPALRDWLAGDFTSSSEIGPPVSGLRSPVSEIPTLLWSPRAGELHFTILDAAPIIGETLRAYGGVILMSATLSPVDAIAAACGLDATSCRSLLLSRRSLELVERAKADAGDKAGIASIRLRQACGGQAVVEGRRHLCATFHLGPYTCDDRDNGLLPFLRLRREHHTDPRGGRLVRAPGQHAKALLHCRRFAQKSYASLLAPEYQSGREIFDDAGFTAWLAEP